MPSPLPSSTLTVPARQLAVTMSSLPLPVRSASVTNRGSAPTLITSGGWNVPSPLPMYTLTVVVELVGNDQIEDSVVGQVAHGHPGLAESARERIRERRRSGLVAVNDV